MPDQPSQAGGQRRRRRQPGGRNRQIKLRVTDAEYERLQQRARRAGASVQRWLMDAAFSALDPALVRPAELRRAVAEECQGVLRIVSAILADLTELDEIAARCDRHATRAITVAHAHANSFQRGVAAVLAGHAYGGGPPPAIAADVQATFREAFAIRRDLAALRNALREAVTASRSHDAPRPEALEQCAALLTRLDTALGPMLTFAALTY